MKKVIKVKPLGDYRLWLEFDDGARGEVDLSDLARRGVFAAWADLTVFSQARLGAGGGVAWPGDIDLCPDALYMRLTGKSVEELFPAVKPTSVDA